MHTNQEPCLDASTPALIVTYGNTPRKIRPLESDLVVLGSGRGCEIVLAAPDIAAAHCAIYRGVGGWRLRDCGSRMGSRLNGKAALDEALRDGDSLQVGTFTFRLHLPGQAAQQEPAGNSVRLQRSRRALARLALRLRRRLHEGRPQPAQGGLELDLARKQAELDRQVLVLREQLRECETRTRQLDEAERNLAAERESMSPEVAAVRARSPEQDEKAVHEETRRLELRRRELAHYAAYLRSQRQQLLKDAGAGGSREAELKQQRVQLDQETAQLRARAAEQDRAVRVKELELLRERTRLAGERLELHRQREELHRELERARDSAGVRGPLGSVGRRSGQMQACPSGPSS